MQSELTKADGRSECANKIRLQKQQNLEKGVQATTRGPHAARHRISYGQRGYLEIFLPAERWDDLKLFYGKS